MTHWYVTHTGLKMVQTVCVSWILYFLLLHRFLFAEIFFFPAESRSWTAAAAIQHSSLND